MTLKNTRTITMKDYTKTMKKILNSCLPIEEKIQALCEEARKYRIVDTKTRTRSERSKKTITKRV